MAIIFPLHATLITEGPNYCTLMKQQQ